jgi:hypothetical protein
MCWFWINDSPQQDAASAVSDDRPRPVENQESSTAERTNRAPRPVLETRNEAAM